MSLSLDVYRELSEAHGSKIVDLPGSPLTADYPHWSRRTRLQHKIQGSIPAKDKNKWNFRRGQLVPLG